MESDSSPRVIDAKRFRNGVIVTFEDGRAALYSAALLYSRLPEAEEVVDSDDEGVIQGDAP